MIIKEGYVGSLVYVMEGKLIFVDKRDRWLYVPGRIHLRQHYNQGRRCWFPRLCYGG